MSGPFGFLSWISSAIKGFKKDDALSNLASKIIDNADAWIQNLGNSITGAHMTGSQFEANEMQMQNVEDTYQRQVVGMQKAGLNPALMYQNGSSNVAPSVSGNVGTGSMSDIMQLAMLPVQMKLAKAQIGNVNADTREKVASAAGKEIENEFKPAQLALNLRKGEVDIDNALAGISQIQKNLEKMDSEIAVNTGTLQLQQSQIHEIEARASEEEWRAANLQLEQAGIRANNALIAERVVLTRLEQAYRIAQTSLTDAQTQGELSNTTLVNLKSFEQKYNNLWLEKYGKKPGESAPSQVLDMTTKFAGDTFNLLNTAGNKILSIVGLN